ncbi:MAG TPA: hypothetical protein VHK63_08180 [Candidatus Limnocylindria bacterium]|nr:hypothetical protein [Candidatus Limnocylindria bacterium]
MSGRRAAVAAGVVVVLLVAAAGALALRPPIRASAGDVGVECAASAGLSEPACASWGQTVVAAGPPSRTFEMEDLGRLTLERGWFGLAPSCEARWYTTRYPDEPVATRVVDCPG